METKTIFLFKHIWNWSIVIFLLAISGLVLQLAFDFYLTVSNDSMIFGGWGWTVSALLLFNSIVVLILLMVVEIGSVIQLILLKRKPNTQILFNADHSFGSIILLPISFMFTVILTYFSVTDAAIYNAQVRNLPSVTVDFYGLIPTILSATFIVLFIIIIVKHFISIFWADEEKS